MKKQYFIHPDDVETTKYDWGRSKWLCTKETCNADALSANIVIVEPGEGHTMHNHPGVEEFLYFIAGRGEQVVADEKRSVGPGDLVYIPRDICHETMNQGWEPLIFLAVYSKGDM